MRGLGIITARGGSKALPHKNLALIDGRPLLAYTADAVKDSARLTRVVLSTDDEEIARVGREYGLEVPFLRPAELARDDTPTLPVLQDVVRQLKAAAERYDAVMTLQPTSPLAPRLISTAVLNCWNGPAPTLLSHIRKWAAGILPA